MRLAGKFLIFLLCASAVFAQVTITTSSPLQSATLNTHYNLATANGEGIVAIGRDGDYRWDIVTSGPGCTGMLTGLPPGLALDTSSGVEFPSTNIVGAPTATGTFTFCVQADPTDETPSATKTFSLTVNPLPTITTITLPSGFTGTPYSQPINVTGGTTPFTFSACTSTTDPCSPGSLPPGLSLNSSTGVISGTPTTAGTFNFAIRASDRWGAKANEFFGEPGGSGRAYTVTISVPLVITTASPLSPGTVGASINRATIASGGTTPYTWSFVSGTLPPGTSFTDNVDAGLLSGTPTSAGTFNFRVRVMDSLMQTNEKDFSIVINAAPNITTTSLPAATRTGAYSQSMTNTGGTPSFTWFITTGSLPTGLMLTSTGANAGLISGTVGAGATLGANNFTARVLDGSGAFDDQPLSIIVNDVPNITTTSLPNGRVTQAYSQTPAVTGGTAPLSWSISAGALPGGLSINPSSGTISGMPSAAGTFGFTVRVLDANNVQDTQAYTVTISTLPTITTTSLPNGTPTVFYSQALAGTGGVPSYTWAIISGALPTGLSLDSSSGTISGTPTTAGSFNFVAQLLDSGSPPASATQSLTIVIGTAPTIITTTLPNGMIGAAYSQTLMGSGGTTPYTWSISAGALPGGLSLNSSSGQISGSPTTAGTSNFTAQLTDAVGVIATRALSITVTGTPVITSVNPNMGQQGTNNLNVAITGQFTNWAQGSTGVNFGAGITINSVTVSSATSLTANISIAGNAAAGARTLTVTTGNEVASGGFTVTAGATLTISTSPLPSGTAGAPYSAQLTATGGTPPYSWTVTGGTLPSGLSLSSAGVLSGTPTQVGTFNFNVTVTDSQGGLPFAPFTSEDGRRGASASASFSLTIGSSLQITTTALPPASAGVPYSVTLAATGGIPPYTWSIQSGSLPAGLTMSTAGVISGTPSVSSPVQFEAKVTDSIGTTATKSFSVTVQPIALEITTQTIPNGTVGVLYVTSMNAAGGDPPYSWSLQNSDIPGLSMSSAGELRGTPTVAGTYSVNVLVTDQANTSTGKQFRLVIASPKLEISTGSLPSGVVGAAYSTTVSATGGLLPYIWSSAGLPGGLSMNSAGAISGTPTAPGTFQVSVTVTDAERSSATRDFTVRVVAPLEITTQSPVPPATVAVQYSVSFAAAGGLPPYRWSGSGPGGLVLSPEGVLSGRPTTAGRPDFEITVTDSENRTTTKQFSVEIFPELIFVTQSPLPRATVGVPYATSVSASGGRPPYRFSGSGPSGLSIDVNGAISGTPSAPGGFSFQIEVTDSGNVKTSQAFDITIVDPLMVTTSSLPAGTLGTAYSASLSASGGRAPLSWSVSAGSLPAGLSVSSGGTITGTPTAPGTSTFTVTVTDADNQTASRQLGITVNPPPVSGGTVTGIPANPQPQTQLNLNVVLPAPYPLDLTLTLTLTFASEVGGDDQTIQFSTGGRTATLIIPAGQTQAPSTVGLQTGTVAGTITVTAVVRAAGMDVTPQPPPRATITIPRGAPVLTSLQIQRTGTGLNLTAIGYTVTRSATQAVLTLEPASGANLQTTTVTVNVAAVFEAYFVTAAANATGGQFRLVLPLTINGDQTAIRSISMTLSNSSGASQPASALVP